MTIKKQRAEELLGLNKFEVDEECPHVILDKDICSRCTEKPCLYVCPAVLYTLNEDTINFDHAGCLECGTCRLVCQNKGIQKWEYPRGSFGIAFRYG